MSDIIVELVVPAVIVFGSALLGALRSKSDKASNGGVAMQAASPRITGRRHAAANPAPPDPPHPAYGFTADEEGRGYEPEAAIARAEAAGAGDLAKSSIDPSTVDSAHSRQLAAHRRRWRRALIDSVVIRPYDK